MTTTSRRTMTAALALALALGVSACSTADDPTGDGVQVPTSNASADDAPGATEPAGTDDEGVSDDASGATDDEAGATDDADDTTAAGSGVTGDLAAALAAIEAAEAEVGGDATAYEIDDQDADGSWEIDVRDADRSIEVTVAADGSILRTEEERLDADDKAALDSAKVTLAEAINAAIDEVGGVFDDAELDEENGTYAWEVEVDGTDRGDDVTVRIDLQTGEVLSVS